MNDDQIFRRRDFSYFYDDGCGAVYSGLTFIDCTFSNCWLSIAKQLESKNVFRRINLINSFHYNCGIDAAAVEDSCADGLVSKGDPFFAHGAVYRHFVLKGKLDPIILKSRSVEAVEDLAIRQMFDEAKIEYYSNVDWAIDITEAECSELVIHGVPADLIRRDPETQAVVRSHKISPRILGNLSWLGSEFQTSLNSLLKLGEQDVVLVAPKRRRKFRIFVDEIKRLRDLGIADVD